MKNTRWFVSLAATLLMGLIALPFVEKPAAAGPPVAEVKIDNFIFTPAAITVKAGTKITWTNADDIPHTVVADDQSFKSKVLDSGDHFSFTFAKAGQFGYFCSLHPHMTGTIIVKA